jgi:hypothetical protein
MGYPMIPLSGRYNLAGKGGHAIFFRYSANLKKYSSQIANPQIATFAEGPQIATFAEGPQIATFAEGPQIFNKIEVRKFSELRFAKLICEPPTLAGWSIPLTR